MSCPSSIRRRDSNPRVFFNLAFVWLWQEPEFLAPMRMDFALILSLISASLIKLLFASISFFLSLRLFDISDYKKPKQRQFDYLEGKNCAGALSLKLFPLLLSAAEGQRTMNWLSCWFSCLFSKWPYLTAFVHYWDRWFWLEMSCSDSTIFILNYLRPKKSIVCNSDFFTYLQNDLVSLVRTSKIIEICGSKM